MRIRGSPLGGRRMTGGGVGGDRGGKRTHEKTGDVIEFFLETLTLIVPCDSVYSCQSRLR